MDYLYRTDTIMIKKSDPLFQIIDNLSFLAKNIYNSALYIERQSIIKNGKVINYSNLNSLHKQLYPQDYTSLPIQTTQQILMLAARNCHSFSKATNEYFLQAQNISVYITEESYTSGTSYLDKEDPTKENYNKSRRIHRGLFRSDQGHLINADVNAAFQIIKKKFNVTNYPPQLLPYLLQPKKVKIA